MTKKKQKEKPAEDPQRDDREGDALRQSVLMDSTGATVLKGSSIPKEIADKMEIDAYQKMFKDPDEGDIEIIDAGTASGENYRKPRKKKVTSNHDWQVTEYPETD